MSKDDIDGAHGSKRGDICDREVSRSDEVHVIPRNNLWLSIPGLLIVTFLGSLDSTIVSTALPTISQDLQSSSQSAYSAVGIIYLLTCTVIVPVTGKFTDIFGMKPMLYSGIALFVLSSGLCGAAESMNQLIAFRGMQGLGRGMMRVSTQIIISNIITLQDRGLINSVIGTVHSLSNALGPLIGGAIVEHIPWSWCFWINLPSSAVALVLIFFYVNVNQPIHASFRDKFKTFDFLGLVLIVGGSIAVLLGFSFASTLSWKHAATISLLVIGWVTLIAFGFWQVKAERIGLSPIVPPRLFKSITPTAILIGCATHSMAFYIIGFYMPLYFQWAKLDSALIAGLHVLPFAAGSSLFSIAYGYLLSKYKRYRPILWPCWVIYLLGNALIINLDANSSMAKQVLYLLVIALGNGGLFSTPLTALQACMTLKQTNTSTSSFTFVRDLAGTMGISLGGLIIHSQAVRRLSHIDGAERFIDLSQVKALKDADVSNSLRADVQQAYSKAIATTFIFTSCVIAVGVVSSLFIKKYTLDVKNVKEDKANEEEKEGRKTNNESQAPTIIATPSDTASTYSKDMEKKRFV